MSEDSSPRIGMRERISIDGCHLKTRYCTPGSRRRRRRRRGRRDNLSTHVELSRPPVPQATLHRRNG